MTNAEAGQLMATITSPAADRQLLKAALGANVDGSKSQDRGVVISNEGVVKKVLPLYLISY